MQKMIRGGPYEIKYILKVALSSSQRGLLLQIGTNQGYYLLKIMIFRPLLRGPDSSSNIMTVRQLQLSIWLGLVIQHYMMLAIVMTLSYGCPQSMRAMVDTIHNS